MTTYLIHLLIRTYGFPCPNKPIWTNNGAKHVKISKTKLLIDSMASRPAGNIYMVIFVKINPESYL